MNIIKGKRSLDRKVLWLLLMRTLKWRIGIIALLVITYIFQTYPFVRMGLCLNPFVY